MPTTFQWETIFGILIAAGLGTYLLRLSAIVLVRRLSTKPERVSVPLQFVPPAVLAALAIATLVRFSLSPGPTFVFDPVEIFAGLVGVVVAWRTRNVLATITIGMLVLWVTQLVVMRT